MTDDDDPDEDNSEEHNQPLIDGYSSPKSLNGNSSFSFGKIKILKPHRRKRFWLFKCCTFSLVLIFLTVLIALLKSLFTSSYRIDFERIKPKHECSKLNVTNLWNQTFPMLTIESALRLVDVNNDTFLDVIVAFGTGADAAYYPNAVCQIYFNFSKDHDSGCGGGVMALDGKTGSTIWRRYSRHEVFAVNCELDLTDDTVPDCIVGGRMATLFAVNGVTGEIIWTVANTFGDPIAETSNFYTPLYISKDVDGDSIPDILMMHGGDPLRSPTDPTRLAARLIIFSAKTGSILTWSFVPDRAESYYSPQELIDQDGTSRILFGTGGETRPGSLYVIMLSDLLSGKVDRAKPIYTDCCKGIMVPPVIIDINGDKILDIVMSMFNSTVIAFDGSTFEVIWQTNFNQSETYSTPAVGYFNNDDTPDFFVSYQHGPGFPIYYYSEAQILNGKNGRPLLNESIKMLVGTQSSPLTLSSLTGKSDTFLYWYSSCSINTNKTRIEDNIKPFRMMSDTNVHDASRADFCSLRFNSTLFTQLRAVNRRFKAIIYDSNENFELEHQFKIDYTKIKQNWLKSSTTEIPQTPSSTMSQVQNEDENNEYFDNQRSNINMDSNQQPDQIDQNEMMYNGRNGETRRRRHVGVHDGEGVQRVISTPTLAPSARKHSIDIIFATFWIPPAANAKIVSNEMQSCINRYLDPEIEANVRLLDSESKLFGFDHDAYVDAVEKLCKQETEEKQMVAEQQQQRNFDPLIRKMGSMTVYRKSLSCVDGPNTFQPYSSQIWPGYMGKNGNSLANLI